MPPRQERADALNLFAVVLALLGLEAPVQHVVDALSEKGCPRLYPMLSAAFQKSVPASEVVRICSSVGHLDQVEPIGVDDGAPAYHAYSKGAEWRLRLVLEAGRVSLLQIVPWVGVETAKSLGDKLAEVGARYHLPGVAALMMQGERVTQRATWGVRKLGDKTPVGPDDRWHLGSDTKAMTATLVALQVQRGKLAWSTPISAALPEWKDLDPLLAKVTIEQLLSHRAGLPHDVTRAVWTTMVDDKDSVAGRKGAVHAMLRLAPEKRGEYSYSNLGYMTLGVILERVTGEPWETLMRKQLFAPLGMRSCGFGSPATIGHVDAPWAHRVKNDALEPVEPGPESDNPPALGPAGTVSCSLADWATFVREHVRGERGEKTTLAIDTSIFRKLHTGVGSGSYALGWGVAPMRWSAGPVLTHDGSNGMFYATVFAAPKEDVILLVATNRGGDEATAATHAVVSYLASTLPQR